ncbi:MAG TPA: aminotransferase class I/II-fold pyridoxal phosphate-dependent enzyme [Gemmatimonadaceae bacterium]
MDAFKDDEDLAPESRSGRRETLDRLMPIVYEHLRVIARHQLAGREGGGTLDPVARGLPTGHPGDDSRDEEESSLGFVYLCNPNNATGRIVTRDEVRQLLDAIPEDVPVLIDEAYHHFVEDPAYETSMNYVKEGRSVIVARTFSKIAGVAGMRLGYAVAPREQLAVLRPYATGSVNACVRWGAVAALADKANEDKVRRATIEQRQKAIAELKTLGYETVGDQLLHGAPEEAGGSDHCGVPEERPGGRPAVPAPQRVAASLDRNAGRNGEVHGGVQGDHGAGEGGVERLRRSRLPTTRLLTVIVSTLGWCPTTPMVAGSTAPATIHRRS